MIEDIRTEDQFKVITFSKYKRTDVKKEWLNTMNKGLLEACCYWTTELICSGLVLDLWELIFLYSFQYIHAGNPKLPLYLDMRYQNFKKAIDASSELALRNNSEIRKLFLEIVCVLASSKRKHAYEMIAIPKEDGIPTSRLKAPTIEFNHSFKPSDSKELFIPMNEFSYMLYSKNAIGACFWIEWLFSFLHKRKCVIVEREYSHYKKDPIWLVWDTILYYAKDPIIEKIVKAIINLFCVAYSPSSKEKRRFMLYYAVTLCCEPIIFDVEIISNKKIIEQAYIKGDLLFKDIKTHEVK
jgi:hypothetical protein